MYSFVNIPKSEFEENFWKTVHKNNVAEIAQETKNKFYAFYKRGDPIFINASNDYDMLLKLHKNTKTFINDFSIYNEIMRLEDEETKKEFYSEEVLYKYYVEEILSVLRLYDFHYEELNVIQ